MDNRARMIQVVAATLSKTQLAKAKLPEKHGGLWRSMVISHNEILDSWLILTLWVK